MNTTKNTCEEIIELMHECSLQIERSESGAYRE